MTLPGGSRSPPRPLRARIVKSELTGAMTFAVRRDWHGVDAASRRSLLMVAAARSCRCRCLRAVGRERRLRGGQRRRGRRARLTSGVSAPRTTRRGDPQPASVTGAAKTPRRTPTRASGRQASRRGRRPRRSGGLARSCNRRRRRRGIARAVDLDRADADIAGLLRLQWPAHDRESVARARDLGVGEHPCVGAGIGSRSGSRKKSLPRVSRPTRASSTCALKIP